MKSALIAFLVATTTASAAIPTPIGGPTEAQYNRLKQRVAALYACMDTGVPIVTVTGQDGREYLVVANQPTTARISYLVENTCTGG